MIKKITIAIDAMGGDNSPDKSIHGVKFFLEKKGSNLSFLPYVIHKNNAQDIDNLDDWKNAKKLYRLKNRFSE